MLYLKCCELYLYFRVNYQVTQIPARNGNHCPGGTTPQISFTLIVLIFLHCLFSGVKGASS